MADDYASSAKEGTGQAPFPSRKDLHGSRIPKSNTGLEQSLETGTTGPSLRDSVKPTRPATEPVVPADSPAEPEAQGTTGAGGPAWASLKEQPATEPQQSSVPESAGQPEPKRAPGPDVHRVQAGQAPQTAAAKAKKRKRRKALRTTLILVFLLALVGTAVWFALNSLVGQTGFMGGDSNNDYPGPGHGEVTVAVNSGDLGSDIGQTLVDAGVVKSVSSFVKAFNMNSAAATLIRPGNYTMKLEMSSAGALMALLDETNRRDNTFTIHPGQVVSQIKESLVQNAGFSAKDIDAAFADADAIGLPPEANGNAEGWLAPGEYTIDKNDDAAAVIKKMVAKQVEILSELKVPRDQWLPVLIKASILEREAGGHHDLAKIARVIDNRLEWVAGETAGFLQMDSTALYGVGKTGGLPTADDLADPNPYNTYVHKGLPPGPIGSPSREAIEATLNPAEGDWLYFVTVNLDTGETLFANTLAEQQANQELLNKWCEDTKKCG